MNAIYKYELSEDKVQWVSLPLNSTILSVVEQYQKIVMYAIVDSKQEERVSRLELEKQELEAKYSRLEESLKKQTTNAFDGWEKVIELEKEKEEYEQALEFGIKYLQASDIGQVQIVVQAMKEALGE